MLGPHDLEEYFGLLEEPREEAVTAVKAKMPRPLSCPICTVMAVRHHLPFPVGPTRRLA